MARTDTWLRVNVPLGKFILKRIVLYLVVLVVAMFGVFALIHLGPFETRQLTVGTRDPEQMMRQMRALNRPLGVQYVEFLVNMVTFDFGTTVGEGFQFHDQGQQNEPTLRNVNTILLQGLVRTAWLWGLTAVIVVPVGVGIGVVLGWRGTPRSHTTATVSGALLRATPMLVIAVLLRHGMVHSEYFLFGFDLTTFLVRTPVLRPFFHLDSLADPRTVAAAVKLTLPYAIALGSAFLGTMIRVGQRAVHAVYATEYVGAAKTRGLSGRALLQRHVLRNAARPLVATLSTNVGILIGGTMLVESLAPAGGFGLILVEAMQNLNKAIVMESTTFEYRILQAAVFVVLLVMIGAKLLEDMLLRLLDGPRTDEEHRVNTVWIGSDHTISGVESLQSAGTHRLQVLGGTPPADGGLVGRMRENPRPAILWAGGVLVLVAVEFGAVIETLEAILPWVGNLADIPTLLSREVIPNRGYQVASGAWQHTFMGLSPATAWAIRVGCIYLYAVVWIVWAWVGYSLFRWEYRAGGPTPLWTALSRFRSNGWGMAGFVIVFVVVVAAVFAPAMGPTTLTLTRSGAMFAGSLSDSGDIGRDVEIKYFDEEQGTVVTTTVHQANQQLHLARVDSFGPIDPLSYDRYGRFHPFGTTYTGTDLFTEMLVGARVYLIIGVGTVGIAGLLTLVFGLLSRYYEGAVNRGVSVLSDSISTAPMFLVIALLSAYFFHNEFSNSSIIGLGFVIVLFGILLWPDLWRTMRGPATAVVSEHWVEAGRASGHRPRTVVWSAVVPRLVGPFLVYGVLTAAGAIITTAGLSVIAILPVPLDWTHFMPVVEGPPVGGPLHTLVIPVVALGLLTVGLTAFADGIQDAIDPTHEFGTSSVGEARGAGGGG